MRRVLYTIYIELDDRDFASDVEFYRWDDPKVSKSKRTQIELRRNYDRLRRAQADYADQCEADYIVLTHDDTYVAFREQFPALTAYQVINLYKFYAMERLSLAYDELLYFDLDVIPNTTASMFDAFDFAEGICVRSQTPDNPHLPYRSERDPAAKYRLTQFLLSKIGIACEHEVTNTGILGIHAADVRRLNYFGRDFPDLMEATESLGFAVNNEALLSYRLCESGVSVQWLPDAWHHIYDSKAVGRLDKTANLIHVINKRFDDIWEG